MKKVLAGVAAVAVLGTMGAAAWKVMTDNANARAAQVAAAKTEADAAKTEADAAKRGADLAQQREEQRQAEGAREQAEKERLQAQRRLRQTRFMSFKSEIENDIAKQVRKSWEHRGFEWMHDASVLCSVSGTREFDCLLKGTDPEDGSSFTQKYSATVDLRTNVFSWESVS